MGFGLVGRMLLNNAVTLGARGRPFGIEGIVGKTGRFYDVPQDVDSKPVDAAIEPETQDIHHRHAQVRVAPIEIGLLFQERVQIILARGFVPLPGRTPEIADPIVGGPAIGGCIAPDIPVALGVVARRAARPEPGMLVGTVVGHVIEHHLEPKAVRGGQQAIERGEIAEHGVDAAIVGDVIAEVGHRRRKDRG